MRELTKSMISFSWAMSLFGIKQLANVLTPQKAAGSFSAVTGATEGQFGELLKPMFRAGDALQRGMVDMTFGFLTPQVLNPNWWLKMTSDAMQRSAKAFRQAGPGDASGSSSVSSGWGPVSR